MSAPISVISSWGPVPPAPGIASSLAAVSAKGASCSSILAMSYAARRVRSSMRSSIIRQINAWRSSKWPLSASSSAESLARMRPAHRDRGPRPRREHPRAHRPAGEGIGTLTIVPHRWLHLIPFWALPAPEGVPLSVFSSVDDFVTSRSVPRPASSPETASPECLVVADPTGDLLCSASEAESAARLADRGDLLTAERRPVQVGAEGVGGVGGWPTKAVRLAARACFLLGVSDGEDLFGEPTP